MLMKWTGRLILFLYALLIALPLYVVLISAFKSPQTFFCQPAELAQAVHVD